MDTLDDEVRGRFEFALGRLRSAGAAIDGVRIPHASSAPSVYLGIQLAEASAYHAVTLERQPQDYQPGVRQRLELGRYVLAEDYVRAQRGREVLRCEVDAALGGRSALVLPTLPIPAPRFGDDTISIGGLAEPVRALMLRLTQLFDLTGHPAISIPCGTTAAGLPCGLQLVGRINRTDDLLAVALACEEVMLPA
jgi:aspartyl-tRNA(Asn)/glutamyl-tRNA(Gln) amidotransferase subunit A